MMLYQCDLSPGCGMKDCHCFSPHELEEEICAIYCNGKNSRGFGLKTARCMPVSSHEQAIRASQDAKWREKLKGATETNGYLGCGIICDTCRNVSGYGKTRGCKVAPIDCPLRKLAEEGVG